MNINQQIAAMIKLNTEKYEKLESPKNIRTIATNKIAEKYSRTTAEKGQTGLSPFYSYIITDEWVEIEKPHKEKLPEDQRHYLGLITILCDMKTKEPIKKGSVSLNKLIQPYPTYEDNDIKNVQQITNIPSFSDCPDSMVEYAQKYITGKFLHCTGGNFKAIKPDYSMGTPSLYGLNGEKLQEREVALFEIQEIEQ